jgi:hypothetical protein
MAGTYSPSARPKRPGAYFNFRVRQQEPALENTLGTVALPFTHSWGPGEQVVELNSFADFLNVFGRGSADPTVFSEGYKAVHDAFRGEGVDGRGGAGRVLAFRMEDATAAKSSKALNNTLAAAAITLTAVYNGVYGQQISVAVVPDPNDAANYDNLVLYVEGFEVERYRYPRTNITDLAAQINGTTPYTPTTVSSWVRASAVTSGTALAAVTTPTALTGGNDGAATILAADFTAFMSALDGWRFSLVASTTVDTTIQASLAAWAKNLNTKGKRFMTVFGGALAESLATAVTGASAFNDPNILRLGIGTYTDDRFGDLSTAQLAPRIAGILAWRGEALGITYARLAGLSIKTAANDSDFDKAAAGGVLAIARDSYRIAPVRLETAVTTYTTTSDPARPASVFGDPKFVRIMHGLETELTEFAESKVIGLLPINDGTRDYVRGQM